jgi:hypothetical protein
VFFIGSRAQLNLPKTGGYSRFRLVLAITALPRFIRLNKATTLHNLPRSVDINLALPRVPLWFRNFSRIPFFDMIG